MDCFRERKETVTDITGIELTPGTPKLCKGNGKTLDESGRLIECCCDECDYFLACFPLYEAQQD